MLSYSRERCDLKPASKSLRWQRDRFSILLDVPLQHQEVWVEDFSALPQRIEEAVEEGIEEQWLSLRH